MTFDNLIEFLHEVNDLGVLDEKAKRDIRDCGLAARYGPSIMEYLQRKNVDEFTFEDGTAPIQILNVLLTNEDVETYIKFINNPIRLDSIPAHGNFRNILTMFKDQTIKDLLLIEGKEGGRGVGKGEVFLASIFRDVKMQKDAKGDCDWNGKYLEVKGTSARLGGRDRVFTNFYSTKFGKYFTPKDKEDIARGIVNNNISWFDIDRFCKAAWPHGDYSVLDGIDLHNDDLVRKALTKIYFSNYASHEGVDWFVFINTKKDSPKALGNYRVFNVDEMYNLIDENRIGSGRIKAANLDPCITAVK